MQPVSPVIEGFAVTKIAEHQDEYNTLPAIVTHDGEVISRWKLTFRERLAVLFKGNVFLTCATFGRPVQPVYLQIDPPGLTTVSRPAN